MENYGKPKDKEMVCKIILGSGSRLRVGRF